MEKCKISFWDQAKQMLPNLSPSEFRSGLKNNKAAVLLDCRTEEEYTCSRLEGARHFDYLHPNFLENMESLDPEVEYYLYCRSGRRSIRTCVLLKNGGIQHVHNLDGGLVKWNEELGEEMMEWKHEKI